MPREKKPVAVPPPVVIDTREQTPYEIPGSVRGTLQAGDYSLLGHEASVAIERKSLSDAYGSIGGGRERFQREWEALSRMDYAAVVIESSLAAFLDPPPYARIQPHVALRSYLAWHVRYGVHLFFADDRRHATALVQRLLGYWWTYNVATANERKGEALRESDHGSHSGAAQGSEANGERSVDRVLPGA